MIFVHQFLYMVVVVLIRFMFPPATVRSCFTFMFVMHDYLTLEMCSVVINNSLEPCLLLYFSYRFPIVEPDPGHTKLRISREGLEAIQRITTPIAAVAVSLSLTSLNTC